MYLARDQGAGHEPRQPARYLGVSSAPTPASLTATADIPPAVVLLLRALLHYNARPVVPLAPRYARSQPLQPTPDLT